jgi:hypothetical protein
MIRIENDEFVEGDLAINIVKVTFFGFTIYQKKCTTANKNIVDSLQPIKEHKVIKGFNHETEN